MAEEGIAESVIGRGTGTGIILPVKKQVLNHGHIILEGYFGGDLTIVNAARQSFNKESTEMGEYEKGLINYLIKNRHGSPIEMVSFRFNIKLPIFVMREWIRHRIASYNERSGRYTKLDPEFYVPTVYRQQEGKSGSYTFTDMSIEYNHKLDRMMNVAYKASWTVYEALLEEGVAKEIARSVLPVGIYTQFTWKINLRSLFNFLSLRTDERAMYEIRQYANCIEEMIQLIVPVSWAAWNSSGRGAP
jgi:thymidylate synthase (FAD)